MNGYGFRMTALAKIRDLFRRRPLTDAERRRREEARLAEDQTLDRKVALRGAAGIPMPDFDDPDDETQSGVADTGGDATANEAAMAEESAAPDEGEGDIKRMETTAGGAAIPGIASSGAAEAAESQIASEEAPSDPAP